MENPVLSGNLEPFKAMPRAKTVAVVVKTEHSFVSDNLHFPEDRTFTVYAAESVCPVQGEPCKPLSDLLFAARMYLSAFVRISEVVGAGDSAVGDTSCRLELGFPQQCPGCASMPALAVVQVRSEFYEIERQFSLAP